MQHYKALNPHNHHHNKNFPPRAYTDLSRSDIHLLATLLSATPANQTNHISSLPSHLRSRHPRLTTLCPTHKRLNPLPLISFSRSLEAETNRALQAKLLPIQVQRLLTVFDNYAGKCVACRLSHLSQDEAVLEAVGSVLVATLSARNAPRSKRVLWVECCLARVRGDAAVGRMWVMGAELREVLRGGRAQVEVLSGDEGSPTRPLRERLQEDHVSFVSATLGREEQGAQHRFDGDSFVFGEADIVEPAPALTPTRTHSPAFSDHPCSPEPSTQPSTPDSHTFLINPFTATTSPSLHNPNPNPSTNPTLPPVSLPRSAYGNGLSSRTSKLWTRKIQDRAPRFWRGRDGVLRGPLDDDGDELSESQSSIGEGGDEGWLGSWI